jgi:hypothetical protein
MDFRQESIFDSCIDITAACEGLFSRKSPSVFRVL